MGEEVQTDRRLDFYQNPIGIHGSRGVSQILVVGSDGRLLGVTINTGSAPAVEASKYPS